MHFVQSINYVRHETGLQQRFSSRECYPASAVAKNCELTIKETGEFLSGVWLPYETPAICTLNGLRAW